MKNCPVCRHTELEGELFCTECGGRLVLDDDETTQTMTFINTSRLREAPRPVTDVLRRLRPGQIALSILGMVGAVILEGRPEYVLGREGGDETAPDVNLARYGGREKGVSRVHAVLRRDHNQVLLIDLGSTNGTRVNGAPVAAHHPTLVQNGDEIHLGRLSLKINYLP